ncbi:MAG TPA: hypothetical protein VGE39_20625 [Prosthecobacter sp.]
MPGKVPVIGSTQPVSPAKVPPPARTEWVKSAGWAKDDPLYEEAARLGYEERQNMTWEKERADS